VTAAAAARRVNVLLPAGAPPMETSKKTLGLDIVDELVDENWLKVVMVDD
jgi:hypothetical protein